MPAPGERSGGCSTFESASWRPFGRDERTICAQSGLEHDELNPNGWKSYKLLKSLEALSRHFSQSLLRSPSEGRLEIRLRDNFDREPGVDHRPEGWP